jgi:hypothetical protein
VGQYGGPERRAINLRVSDQIGIAAEPGAGGWQTGSIRHVGHFPELEDQMLNFSMAGYLGERSPDRADALVWAITDLMLGAMKGGGIYELVAGQYLYPAFPYTSLSQRQVTGGVGYEKRDKQPRAPQNLPDNLASGGLWLLNCYSRLSSSAKVARDCLISPAKPRLRAIASAL